jgi:hypothetical protein
VGQCDQRPRSEVLQPAHSEMSYHGIGRCPFARLRLRVEPPSASERRNLVGGDADAFCDRGESAQVRLLDFAAFDPCDLLGGDPRKIALPQALLQAQATQSSTERVVGVKLPLLFATTELLVEFVQDRVRRRLVCAEVDRLLEVRDRKLRDVGFGAARTLAEPAERNDQGFEIPTV